MLSLICFTIFYFIGRFTKHPIFKTFELSDNYFMVQALKGKGSQGKSHPGAWPQGSFSFKHLRHSDWPDITSCTKCMLVRFRRPLKYSFHHLTVSSVEVSSTQICMWFGYKCLV